MRRSVLLVEDEEPIRELVADYFVQASWEVMETGDGKEALELFETRAADLIILDIMIPRIDGWSICRRLRASSAVPIILLTAKSEEEDKLLGFELGADDYVTKPFSPKVLVARAETLMKRVEQTVGKEGYIYEFGSTVVDAKRHAVEVAGKAAGLSYKEYDLLLYLLRNKGLPISRENILNQVWGVDYLGDPRVVDTHIKNIRKKLGGDARCIRTVFRVGYKFEAET